MINSIQNNINHSYINPLYTGGSKQPSRQNPIQSTQQTRVITSQNDSIATEKLGMAPLFNVHGERNPQKTQTVVDRRPKHH